jgi:hypothetical protein
MNDDADNCTAQFADRAERALAGRRARPSKLTHAQKGYVVRRLAAYDGPTEIARDMREKFGVEISYQAVAGYDPTRTPACGKEWADMFRVARKDYLGDKADQEGKSRRVERMVLRTVEILAERILKGVDAEGRHMFVKRPEDITDDDRICALLAFIDRLKEENPAGYAAIQAALSDAQGARARASAAPTIPPGEAAHAG